MFLCRYTYTHLQTLPFTKTGKQDDRIVNGHVYVVKVSVRLGLYINWTYAYNRDQKILTPVFMFVDLPVKNGRGSTNLTFKKKISSPGHYTKTKKIGP